MKVALTRPAGTDHGAAGAGNAVLVSERQAGNPVLRHIRRR